MLLAKNVEAGRLVAGFTISEPGNWTSGPPPEHAKMLEEMYVYFDMPDPGFGIQVVYNRTDYLERVTVVRDGGAVLMPNGYHPNESVHGLSHLVFSGRWRPTAKAKTRSLEWSSAARIRPGIFQTESWP
jgi:5-deoxy-glucuronate isomerase